MKSETLLHERLRAYADRLDEDAPAIRAEEIAAAPAATVTATRRRRMPALLVAAVVAVGIVMMAGVVVFSRSEPTRVDTTGGYREPTEPATSVLAVEALPQLRFNVSELSVQAGVVEVRYVGHGGTHTLVFERPDLDGFELQVSGEEEDVGKVRLAPGEYVIHCDVPGHRAAGMEAVISVVPASP